MRSKPRLKKSTYLKRAKEKRITLDISSTTGSPEASQEDIQLKKASYTPRAIPTYLESGVLNESSFDSEIHSASFLEGEDPLNTSFFLNKTTGDWIDSRKSRSPNPELVLPPNLHQEANKAITTRKQRTQPQTSQEADKAITTGKQRTQLQSSQSESKLNKGLKWSVKVLGASAALAFSYYVKKAYLSR